MNTIYRIVWNAATGKWVVASELAKGRKKASRPSVALALATLTTGLGMAFNVAAFEPIGAGAQQGNANNMVIGDNADASAAGCATIYLPGTACSTVIGNSATSTGAASTVLGNYASVTGSHGVAVGAYATAAIYSQALGTGANASGGWATAIGQNAQATATNATAVGTNSTALGDAAVAFGSGAHASAARSFAMGWNANANGVGAMAFGYNVKVNGENAIALGLGANANADGAVAVGANSVATTESSLALGTSAQASANNAVALGQSSVADRENTISVGTTGAERQVVNVANGAQDTDAVNVSQLKPVIEGLGGGTTIDPVTGVVIGPTYHVGGTDVYNVGDALSNIDGRVNNNTTNITNLGSRITVNEGDITSLKNGTVGLVTQADATAPVNVATSSGGSIVNFAGSDGNRQLKGVADGELSAASTDAVNGSQLFATNERVTKNEGDIVNIRNQMDNGSIGLVQQAGAGADLTVGAGTDGVRVDFADRDGNTRTLAHVSDGALSVDSTDAVNGSQLLATNERVTKNEGDIANVQNDLTAATRYFKADGQNNSSDDAVASGSRAVAMGASSSATSVQSVAIGFGANASAGDGAVAIGANSRATGENSVALGKDSTADRDNVVSVGWGLGGNGTRQIVNVTNGTENTDAVNVQQLKPAIAALGGGATFNANGTVTGPQYTVTDLDNGGNKTVNNVGDALGQLNANTKQLDGRVTTNEGDIVDIRNQLGSGSIGLVQQVGASAAVTVAAATGGTTVDFTGTDGMRQLKGVSEGSDGTDAVNVAQLRNELAKASAGDTRYFKADGANDGTDDAINTGNRSVAIGAGSQATADNAVALGAGSVADRANAVSVGSTGNERQLVNVADGTEDTDAVNVRQLKSAGLVGDDGSLLDAVVYDAGSNRGSITLGGSAGTTITNVLAGRVGSDSSDAINGSQLWGVQNQINQLGDRVTTIENGVAAPVPVPADSGNPGNENPHFASSGDANKPATATGSSSVAAGEGAAASGNSSTAVGAGSSASGNNSVAVGAGSVADSDNVVSVGAVGGERRVSNVATGTLRTDAANVGQLQDAMSNLQDWTQGQVNGLSKKVDNVQRQANRGIAASAALVNNMPYLPGKITLNAGVAAYRGQSALGVGVSRWSDNGRFNVNAGVSAAQGDSPIFRLGVGVVLGD